MTLQLTGSEGPRIVDWLVVSALAVPHILYAFVWLLPGLWRSAFGRRSVPAFAWTASALKLLQVFAVVLWYNTEDHQLRPRQIPPLHALLGLGLIGAGQVLNVSIYRAIGEQGVYYGNKEFPFSAVAHPQYVGSVLSVCGAAVLCFTQAPPGLSVLAVYWSLLYLLTALVEQFL